MILSFGMNNDKNIPNKRCNKEEGHLAQLVRRKMTQKSHGDDSKFNRNKLKHEDRKGPHYILSL